MSSGSEWNHIVTRHIALEQTLVADADLDDTLGGSRLKMFSPDVREIYRKRCLDEASDRGHPVPDPTDIPTDEDTSVMEVGDALFEHSNR